MGSIASSAPARALRWQSGWHAPLSAAVLYVATSIAMNITHAAITERVSLPLTVTGIEMLFACVVLLLIFPRTLHYGNWSDVLTWGSTMPLLFAFGIGFNMLALRHTGVSHTLMIRYVFPFVTLLVESIFTERLPIDVASLLSIMLSAVGVTLFMFTGEGISGEGVLYIILNSLSVISEQVARRAGPFPADCLTPPICVADTKMAYSCSSCRYLVLWFDAPKQRHRCAHHWANASCIWRA